MLMRSRPPLSSRPRPPPPLSPPLSSLPDICESVTCAFLFLVFYCKGQPEVNMLCKQFRKCDVWPLGPTAIRTLRKASLISAVKFCTLCQEAVETQLDMGIQGVSKRPRRYPIAYPPCSTP